MTKSKITPAALWEAGAAAGALVAVDDRDGGAVVAYFGEGVTLVTEPLRHSRKLMLHVLQALARERQTCGECRHLTLEWRECLNECSPAFEQHRLDTDGCDKWEAKE